MPIVNPEFLTVTEVAALLRLSKMTVYRMIHDGEIEAVRIGRSYRVRPDSVREKIG